MNKQSHSDLPQDLNSADLNSLDLASQPAFYRRCYEVLARVPAGKVTTYAEIARALGSKASRAVGTAMASNRALITIPCHRVVRSDGSIGQYARGTQRKAELLMAEGVAIANGKVVNFKQDLFRF